MKKILTGILSVLATAFCFGGCDLSGVMGALTSDFGAITTESSLGNTEKESEDGNSAPFDSDSEGTASGSNSENGDDSESTPSGSESADGGEDEQPTSRYTDFTEAEKALFETYIGEVIPFLANNEYSVEGYYEETDYENGMCFYTCGLTELDYANYRAVYVALGYEFKGTYVDDEYGDTWYWYEKGNIVVDMTMYAEDGESYLEVYVYVEEDEGGEGGTIVEGVDLLTNDGKGLPTGQNGVHTVDMTKAVYAKTVADQGYYLGGCPTVGNVKVLVIPVEFKDVTAVQKGYTVGTIDKAFNGGTGSTDLYSVKEFYQLSSYGKLNLTFDVMDTWFRPQNNSSYYLNATMEYYGAELQCGDQMILDEFLKKYDSTVDFSQYDSDENGMIDAVVMINTLDVNHEVTMQWAYRYWNAYSDANGEYYEYDGVCANDYMWASYQFLHEDEYGGFGNQSGMDTYTYVHEFGHILGADDYYDTSYSGSAPMDGRDIMDGGFGDHNAYTKFHYGWLTTARLITAKDSVTLSLDSFTKTGDAVIIANNWDEDLGAYQEYFLVVYYTNTGLNGGDGGYFDEEGIVVYHVNASLCREEMDGELYYDVYNNNTDGGDEYGTEENLIELVKSADGNWVYGKYDSLHTNTTLDNGEKIAYVFTVNELTEGKATVTFRKNA